MYILAFTHIREYRQHLRRTGEKQSTLIRLRPGTISAGHAFIALSLSPTARVLYTRVDNTYLETASALDIYSSRVYIYVLEIWENDRTHTCTRG